MESISYLSYKECQEHDQFLIKNGTDMPLLISQAGTLISKWLEKNTKNKPLVGIIGKGNNGKDILSAFKQLNSNQKKYIYIVDNKIKTSILYQEVISSTKEIKALTEIPADAFIIDGIFGTGLNKKIDLKIASIINTLNSMNNEIIAIDIPSGLSETENSTCIKAKITLTMMFPKKVFLDKQKAIYYGEVFWLNFQLNKEQKKSYRLPITTDNYIRII